MIANKKWWCVCTCANFDDLVTVDSGTGFHKGNSYGGNMDGNGRHEKQCV